MSNECDFGMLVTGKRKNIEEFLEVIEFFYNINFEQTNEIDEIDLLDKIQANKLKRHIWTTTVTSINKDIFTRFDEKSDDDITTYEIDGYCKWSIYHSMLEGEGTYYDSSKGMNQSTMSSLIQESKLLNLVIECYGDEDGIGIKEYLLIKFGDIEKYELNNFTSKDLEISEVEWKYKFYEDLFY